MNKQEAEKVIKILLTADGGCEYCASALIKLFYKEFPEFKSLAEEFFKEQFGVKLRGLKKGKAPRTGK